MHSSSRPLLQADGSAAAVTLTSRYAYVSEKNGSLEAFPLGRDGTLTGPAIPVTGVSPGTIVGITTSDDGSSLPSLTWLVTSLKRRSPSWAA